MSMREHKQNHLSKTNSWGAGNKHQFLIPLLFLCMLTLAASAFATHTSTANLVPEWTAAGQAMSYTVKITNNGPNAVDEVRIYMNQDYDYSSDPCEEKTGWELNWINAKQACHYIAETEGNRILSKNNDTFNFSATAPSSGCELTWKFETRDVTDTWYVVTDTTSVDDLAPSLIKLVSGPQSGTCPPGSGDECWITQSTTIGIDVTEQGDCGISGLDYCEVTYTVDGGNPIVEIYAELDGGTEWNHSMTFDEDSRHVLTVECKDIAGNMLTDTEVFRVDDTPPTTVKDYGTPFVQKGGFDYATSATPITLTATDGGAICKIGVEYTKYRVCQTAVGGCYGTTWYTENGQCVCPSETSWLDWTETPFTIPEDSEHCIEFYSEDLIENKETINSQCVYVDNQKPILNKTVGGPKVEGDGFDYWITQNTPILLTCTDPQPHPVDNVTIYWTYSVDGGNPVKGSYNGTEKAIYFPEDSVHVLEAWCVDELGNESEHDIETLKVDTVAPTISKDMVGDYLGDCPKGTDLEHGDCYVADNDTSGFDVTVKDGGPVCAVDQVSCTYTILWYTTNQECTDNGYNWDSELDACIVESGTFTEATGLQVRFKEDSTHRVNITCADALRNRTVDDETFLVDSTPPVTTKLYGIPTKVEGGYRWITSSTEITLTANDGKVGTDEIYWRNTLLEIPDDECLEQCQCTPPSEEVFGTVAHNHDSDLSPIAIITKTNNGDSVTFTWEFIKDNIPHPNKYTLGIAFATSLNNPDFQIWIDDSSLEWKHQEYETGWNGVVTTGKSNVEALGFTLVGDSTGKIKSVTVPYNKLGDACSIYYFALQARINIMDKYPETWTPWSGNVSEYAQSTIGGIGNWDTYDVPFYKPEESCHLIEYYAVDKLGNEEAINSQCVFVDNTPPKGIKTIGKPKIECDPIGGKDCWWVRDHVTEITLDCEDQGEHPVEQETACFRVSFDMEPWLTDRYCEMLQGKMTGPNPEDWCCVYVGEEPVSFTFQEDSLHDLEFYCMDHLGNTEAETDYEIFKVDSIPPVTTKTIYPEPYFDGTGAEYIDTAHEITLTAKDGGERCHVDGVETYYKYYRCEGLLHSVNLFGEEDDAFGEGFYTGDYYRNPLALLSELTAIEYSFTIIERDEGISDALSPYIVLISPQMPHEVAVQMIPSTPQGAYDVGTEYDITVDNSTRFHIPGDAVCTQGLPCTLEGVKAEYPDAELTGIKIATGAWPGDNTKAISLWTEIETINDMPAYLKGELYSEPFGIPEESCHVIEYYSADALGNEEDTQSQQVYVDKTPPTTSKEYGDPFYEDEGGEWITSATEITLTVEDTGPHKSGIAETQYRLSGALGDQLCNNCEGWMTALRPDMGDWLTYDEPFRIAEESCHVIEYRSIDNVGKTEDIKWQCVFVDNTPPTPEKTVGEPRTVWDGKDSIFYDIDEFCMTPENCWKVTLLTPIYLECVDPLPHPVDQEIVCFYVERNGDDETEEYCSERMYYGDYNAHGDGFCCMKRSLPEFYFQKECEHNLKYYCVDALGNTNKEIDDEKFKVEGTAFEIQLNKKWNLISVPFVLLNPAIEEVLKDIKENVEAVWTYDAFEDEWYVYRPGDLLGSNLETIEPGTGYWLAALEDDTLIIGGSLFSPATTPPDRDLEEGWNLIGYYGAGGILEYEGPKENGKDVYCALYTLIDTTLGHPLWTSLYTYWEPDNPNQWIGLSSMYDAMDPGAGYWIKMNKEGTYTPTEDCGIFW